MKGYWYDKVNVSIFMCNKGDAAARPDCAKGAVTDDQKKQIVVRPQEDAGRRRRSTYESADQAYKHYQEQYKGSHAGN